MRDSRVGTRVVKRCVAGALGVVLAFGGAPVAPAFAEGDADKIEVVQGDADKIEAVRGDEPEEELIAERPFVVRAPASAAAQMAIKVALLPSAAAP